MIEELKKDNLEELTNNTFLPLETVEKDFESNPFGKYLVYKENEEIIGYLYYSDIYERAEINQIEVNLIHRNCGKGSKLLEKMISLVDKDITLEVRKDNTPALKLYKKYCFVETAIRKDHYNGVDGILIERKKTL